MYQTSIIAKIAIIAFPLLFAITLHEAAHGWVANKLGDKTALMLGRITLNPAKHIDLFGTIILPILMMILSNFSFMFGWAKPVPVNWSNLNHPRRDMALVALAGPGANLLMALMWAAVAKLTLMASPHNPTLLTAAEFFMLAGQYGILINALLLVLNLIPIPPLDGSRVLSSLLPPAMAHKYELIEPYGIWILLAVVFVFGNYLLGPPVRALYTMIASLFNL